MKNPFKQFNRTMLKPLGLLWDKVHKLENMRGDGFIDIKRSGAGTTIGLNLGKARERISKKAAAFEGNRILQVRSWASPKVEGGDSFDRAGIYNCVEMVLNNKPNSGSTSTASQSIRHDGQQSRILDRFGAVSDTYRIGISSDEPEYVEWESKTTYTKDDQVEVITEYTDQETYPEQQLRKVSRIYRSREENIDRPPASNPDIWQDLTVEVFNLPEQYTNLRRPRPKLGKFDLMTAWQAVDNTGVIRTVGMDTVGNTRSFVLDLDATSNLGGGEPIVNMTYGYPRSFPARHAQEGELNYNIGLNVLDGNTSVDFRDVADADAFQANWVYGRWDIIPYNVGWKLTKGLVYEDSLLTVKVDGVTIDFNGSGELEQIP